jgi:3-methyladenine DNA glycosylase AlkD
MPVLGVTVPDLREVVKQTFKDTKAHDTDFIVELAHLLVNEGTLEARQVAYELLGRRKDARSTLGVRDVEALGRGIDNWKSVDVFGCEVSGPCWRLGQISDAAVRRWARAKDRWWRRAALVTTIPLNMRSRGGTGDTARTLDICTLCVADRDDMVVKALSWALRELIPHDAAALRSFVDDHESELAPRIVREVRNKLNSGRKNPRRSP